MAAGQRKVLTRSNSARLGTNSTTTAALQRHGSSHLIVGQNKLKTLTTKVIENKVQVKSKNVLCHIFSFTIFDMALFFCVP